ncbi:PREDICTED: uncharacterized protein LOC109170196 isoform X2 [Ipomoea nil]|uniref:uncharacterized protein LOC109170196 isoform X2 n=1 Tax=Ipomoea nil TaxID=35883 RepID=UPI0009010AE9|nr:PREDICTED: uncharacterized protein LOC109170196 isoform X2 [Ipomoea nil]
MEGSAAAAAAAAAEEKPKEETAPSYTYWVREKTADAAPLPVPRKLNPGDQPNNQTPTHLGSAWNRAGTWEEKSLNKWANDRIKELLVSVGSLELSGGKAEITEVTKCNGDAFLVTVRNKKRVGYTYELTLKVKGRFPPLLILCILCVGTLLFLILFEFYFSFFIVYLITSIYTSVLFVSSVNGVS